MTPFNYGNTDCNNNTLTTDKRAKFNAWIADSICPYNANGGVYVGFCAIDRLTTGITGIASV